MNDTQTHQRLNFRVYIAGFVLVASFLAGVSAVDGAVASRPTVTVTRVVER